MVVALACCAAPAAAQDVESFWSGITDRVEAGDLVRVSGSLTARAALNSFASDAGATRRNAPFTWGAAAGVNFDVLGVQAPFSLAVSSRNTRYKLPSYSFYGASPSYRWITLHAGDRSLEFSPYSLSGVNFRGGGFELSPGKFYVAALRGRLRNERIVDVDADQSGLANPLRRIGQGLKLGYRGTDGARVEASVFTSRDGGAAPAVDSVPALVLPERNAVVALGGAYPISKLLAVEWDAARSGLTRDDTAPELEGAGAGTSLFGLLTPRTTTTAANAVRAQLNFTPGKVRTRLRYERIDPEYRSHGTLFMRNDLENVTAGATVPLFDQRIRVNVDGGLQRNDLRGDRASAMRRVISSGDLDIRWSDRLQTGFGASNFNTTNRYRVADLNRPLIDSIVVAQTQLSLRANASYALDARRASTLIATASFQRAGLVRDDRVDTTGEADFALANLLYAYSPEGSPHQFTAGVMYNRSATVAADVTLVGPSAGYTYAPGEAARLSGGLDAGYNFTTTRAPGGEGGGVSGNTSLVTLGLTAAYRLTDHQSLNLRSSLVRAGAAAPQLPAYTDLQLTLSYGLTL